MRAGGVPRIVGAAPVARVREAPLDPHHLSDLKRLWRRTGILIAVLVVIGIGLAIVVHHLQKPLDPITKPLVAPLKALIVFVIGGAISYVLERYLFHLIDRALGRARTASLRFLIRLFLWMSVLLAVLAAFGVGLSSVVFGGAFFTAAIGLAGQSMFGNLIAGVGLIVFHPFDVGDRISFVAWQYPVLMPSYPHEALKPGYSGIVTDISLMYTTMLTDAGMPMVIPNGIIIQAAVENVSRSAGRTVRMRFDVDNAVVPEALLPAVKRMLDDEGLAGATLAIVDMAPSTFAFVITVNAGQLTEDETRTRVLRRLIPLVRQLQEAPAPARSTP